MKKISRTIFNELKNQSNSKEISILIGPRQVGKTFLLNELNDFAKSEGLITKYYNLEIPSDIIQFNKNDSEIFNTLTDNVDVVFIDEFHYLKNASKLFKAIFDSNKKVKIYASGSSSSEIHKHLKESLAGRRLMNYIHTLNYQEYRQQNLDHPLEDFIIYGGLPGLIHKEKNIEKMQLLQDILETYIQKDIKSLVKEENIRAFNHLLYLIAENQGSLISVNNLAREIGLTPKSIDRYLSILEYTYVAFSVYSYSKNMGNELKKSKKIYFYDTGVRNSILKDFSNLSDRADSGLLHETFVFLELKKQLKPNMELKFWRNKSGNEIDFILLINRKPLLIEVKSNLKKSEIPNGMKIFINNYPGTLGGIVFNNTIEDEVLYNDKKVNFYKYEKIIDMINKIL